MFFLRLYFREESHLYPKCFFDILTIYPKWHLFYFFSRDMCIYIPILAGLQNGHISRLKESVFFCEKMFFFKLLFREEGHFTCMPIACFIFQLFILNAIVFISLVVAYVWHRCFPVNFAKFLRTRFLQNTSRGLLLYSWKLSQEVFKHMCFKHFKELLVLIEHFCFRKMDNNS